MNRKQLNGTLRVFGGRLEEEAGKLTGNRKLQLRGLAKKIAGRAERIVGDATETINAALRRR